MRGGQAGAITAHLVAANTKTKDCPRDALQTGALLECGGSTPSGSPSVVFLQKIHGLAPINFRYETHLDTREVTAFNLGD